jgi:hypothetical protein
MAPRQAWVDGRVDVLLAALHDLGMSASRAAAAELIHERVRWVSAQAGISPTAARRYLTDDALTDLARTMVVTLAEETPGADVIASARTAAVPLPVLARCIAGLAEAIQLRLRERDDIDHLRTTVAELAQTLSAIGQVTADQPARPAGPAPVVVMMPPGLMRGRRHHRCGPARGHPSARRREPALLRRRTARRVIMTPPRPRGTKIGAAAALAAGSAVTG